MIESVNNALIEAWIAQRRFYQNGIICSERHLQALLFHELCSRIGAEFEIYVEPRLEIKSGDKSLNGKKPDLLICNKERKVTHMIELKYVPFAYPEYQGDIKKFTDWKKANAQIKFPLKTVANSGQWNYQDLYQIDQQTQTVYGIIAKADAHAFSLLSEHEIDLLLYGKVKEDSNHEFRYQFKS